MNVPRAAITIPLCCSSRPPSRLSWPLSLGQVCVRKHCWLLENQMGPARRLGPGGVELWVDKEASEGWQAPRWAPPTPEQLQYADGLLQRHLLRACSELERLCGEGQGAAGDAAFGSHTHKVQVNAVLSEVRTSWIYVTAP